MRHGTRRTRGAMRTTPTKGVLTGFGLVLLGIWGAIIPFVGPYFHYGFTPDTTWTWTAARFWLEVLPGAVTFVAGLVLIASRDRVSAQLAGWTAVLAGAWFVVGPTFNPLWDNSSIGTPLGGVHRQMVEQVGMFLGLGTAVALLAGIAVGRFSVVGVRDRAAAAVGAYPEDAVREPVYDRGRGPVTGTRSAQVPVEEPATGAAPTVEPRTERLSTPPRGA